MSFCLPADDGLYIRQVAAYIVTVCGCEGQVYVRVYTTDARLL